MNIQLKSSLVIYIVDCQLGTVLWSLLIPRQLTEQC